MRYMFCFKTLKLYTLVEDPTLFLSLEFNGLGLLTAHPQRHNDELEMERCVHSAALWKTTLVTPLCTQVGFYCTLSSWRGGRKQGNPRGRASLHGGGDKPRRRDRRGARRAGGNRVRDSVGGTTPGCITRGGTRVTGRPAGLSVAPVSCQL